MKITESRIDRLAIRIRESLCPFTVASLADSISADLDPAAIPVLVDLLDRSPVAKESIDRAILRYGEHAEDTLRAAAKHSAAARRMLKKLARRQRFLQVGCF